MESMKYNKLRSFTSKTCSAKLMFSSMRFLDMELPISASLLAIMPLQETMEVRVVMVNITNTVTVSLSNWAILAMVESENVGVHK